MNRPTEIHKKEQYISIPLVMLLLIVTCTVASAMSAAQQNKTSKNSTGASTVMQINKQSSSLILRVTHIMLVSIVEAKPEAWTMRAAGGEERVVSLKLQLRQFIKGEVDQNVDDTIQIKIKQVKSGFAWGPMPGVWSQASVEAGAELVAFSESESSDAGILLNDPAAVELMPANETLTDVMLASQAAELGFSKLMSKAQDQAASLGELFADFLWGQYAGEALSDYAVYEKILYLMEMPDLSIHARTSLIMLIPDSVLAEEPVATQKLDRLAVTMVRILSMPSANALHDNIVTTYLPNLVNAANPESRSAESVFADYPHELQNLKDIAKYYSNNPAAQELVKWTLR